MKNAIGKWIVLGLATVMLSACGKMRTNDQSSESKPTAPVQVVIPYVAPPALPLAKVSGGGYGPFIEPADRVVSTTLYADGKIVDTYGDAHEVQVGQIDKELTAAVAAKVDLIGDADKYELTAEVDYGICDVWYTKELYIKGVAMVVESQEDCGPHKTLHLKENVNLLGMGTNLDYAVYIVSSLFSSHLEAKWFVESP